MAGLIRQSDVDEVKARINLADVVSDFVTLKPAGVGSMKGLCPFHDERSPSFHVRPQAGFYHCFGCGESGDVYTFLQKMDHVTFAEAVQRLAGRVGMELHYEDGKAASDHTARARLMSANAAAEKFFVAQLGEAHAQVGRTFLAERGFDAEVAARFGVGFAPQSWNRLTDHLKGLGYTEEELLGAGLVSRSDRGSVYDRFRGRVVWPIRDVTGQTVGFGARRLLEDDKGPKYLNTPETSIYHKSQVLYGLDLAKRDISRTKRVVIVEGYTDVMACHIAGVTTAVATCGTAFGVDHIGIVRRVLGDDGVGGEVIFTFDPDAAGQKAAMRAFGEEQRFAAQTYVAVGDDGLDPCDLRLKRGNAAVARMVDAKKPLFEFVIRQVLASYNLDTVEGRVAALRAAAPIIRDIRDAALRPGYIRELARMLGLDVGEVSSAVRQTPSGTRTPSRPASPDEPAEQSPAPSLRHLGSDPVTRLERDALMALLQHPTAVSDEIARRALQSPVANPSLAVVQDAMSVHVDRRADSAWLTDVIDEVPEGFDGLVRELAVAPLPERLESAIPVYVRGVVGSLVDKGLLSEKAQLLGRLQRADPSDRDRYIAMQQELVKIETLRRRLREE